MITPVGKSELIPLSYQLDDGPTAPTRYVRAVLLKASDRSTLATVNLTDNGDGDFSNYSKTPLSIVLSNGDYFEAIYSVYKDAAYTQKDTLRYATTKEVFVVKETTSGLIMGSGLRSENSGINLAELAEEIVKRIFKFDKWEEIKGVKSFAKKFIALTEKDSSKDIKGIIQDIKKIMSESDKAMTKTIEQVAELVREQGKAIISDLSKAIDRLGQEDEEEIKEEIWTGFEKKIDQYKGILGDINTKIDELGKKGIDLSSLEKALEEVSKKLTARISKEDDRTLKMLKINKGFRNDLRTSLTGIGIDVAGILSKIK